jgi:hypothetical protein
MERRKRECSCGGHDIGVGIMHEPLCEINDAGQIAMLEQECDVRDARISALESQLKAAREDRAVRALAAILPMAEKWHEREFELVCQHEPDDCQCDVEAVSIAKLYEARAVLAGRDLCS